MNSKFTIHLLADIHVGKSHFQPHSKRPEIPRGTEAQNLERYCDYIITESRDELVPDLVLIAGDFTSNAKPEEFEQSAHLIRKLVGRMVRKRSRWRTDQHASPYIVMVPGNHDLDWTKSSYEEKVRLFAEFADHLASDGRVLSPVTTATPSRRNTCVVDFGDKANIVVCGLNTVMLGGQKDSELDTLVKNNIELRRELYRKVDESNSSLSREAPSSQPNLESRIRLDPGYIHQRDLAELRKMLAQAPQHRIKIALLHHNLSSVYSDSVEQYDAIVNAGVVKANFAEAAIDIVLHGHRHVNFSTREWLPRRSEYHCVRIIGTDSLGTKESAPFLQLELHEPERAHRGKPPFCRISTTPMLDKVNVGYRADESMSEVDVVDSIAWRSASTMLLNLGRTPTSDAREDLLQIFRPFVPFINKLHWDVVDWGDGSDAWIRDFHRSLGSYARIYATDNARRLALDTPAFDNYIRQQYYARFRKLIGTEKKVIYFSKSVYDAILRTGWRPAGDAWCDWDIACSDEYATEQLEIARIILPSANITHNRGALRNLDLDHRWFAIPLLVLPQYEDCETGAVSDFVVAFNRAGEVEKAYEYGSSGTVASTAGVGLAEQFDELLGSESLMTIEAHLGHIAVQDPYHRQTFVTQYDITRRADPQLLKRLSGKFERTKQKLGLEVGCGTGNYAIALAAQFEEVIGIDKDGELLQLARAKRRRRNVRWIHGDIMENCPELDGVKCDAVWMVSALHYFRGEKGQKRLFSRLRPLIADGGCLVADTELEEQHKSLWLVEYFPSLGSRYSQRLFASDTYEQWLKDAGFSMVQFESYSLQEPIVDHCLRTGQRRPERYLDPKIRNGIPAFVEMSSRELKDGLVRLRSDIDSGAIDGIIEQYESRATIEGDCSLIVAFA